jgi:hypothetical protein
MFSARGVALNVTTASVQLRMLENSVYLPRGQSPTDPSLIFPQPEKYMQNLLWHKMIVWRQQNEWDTFVFRQMRQLKIKVTPMLVDTCCNFQWNVKWKPTTVCTTVLSPKKKGVEQVTLYVCHTSLNWRSPKLSSFHTIRGTHTM